MGERAAPEERNMWGGGERNRDRKGEGAPEPQQQRLLGPREEAEARERQGRSHQQGSSPSQDREPRPAREEGRVRARGARWVGNLACS